ncbi:MAG TPA: BsaWI family type II restriction enzyme [Patescibacteria group bacterium]|nr:BsaWI family type II restriction enzyme [Patescibacteria group bacterium]
MKFDEVIKIYEIEKKKYGREIYKHISDIFKKAKEIHKKDFTLTDHEQSWRSFKGKNLEKLIMYIIQDQVESLGLKIISGSTFERTGNANLPPDVSKIKRNLLIDYGEFGHHLPDVDLIIYNPKNCKVLAAISSKVTLRERIAQTGYWKLKFLQDPVTKNIKVFFITPDEDGTLTSKKPTKKGRAIVEVDTDGSYVMSDKNIDESDKVKSFDKFIEDLRRICK